MRLYHIFAPFADEAESHVKVDRTRGTLMVLKEYIKFLESEEAFKKVTKCGRLKNQMKHF